MVGRGGILLSASAAGGGAVVGAGVGLWRLALVQGTAADRKVRPLTTPAPPVREFYGNPTDAPFVLAMVGDSSAQGTGVHHYDDTLGGWLASSLAATGRHVRVVSTAVDGARAEHLGAQIAGIARATSAPPDLVVISIGVNDIRARTPAATAARQLGAAVAELRRGGSTVLVGTTPDLSVIAAVRAPLRQVVWLLSWQLERAQTPAVRAAGGTPVRMRTSISQAFAADPALFAADGLHASSYGNACIGAAMFDTYQRELAARAEQTAAQADPAVHGGPAAQPDLADLGGLGELGGLAAHGGLAASTELAVHQGSGGDGQGDGERTRGGAGQGARSARQIRMRWRGKSP
ncbi:SGNH/GDSL hydrolase family protein [Frankia sp. AgPm24]|uniref:SGNH/GDSL hydrolase family protein n=1 Tax=Frankia sp. AgPm24 TaxID=631128 RepID=UPI00200C67F4|nr:SGNH/GDSL hydrolase family protein [Frankia sp. AgPm24]MCK9922030.1 SGNH/GDSL hydrolase family protein [Frankia sp. AgPm24]